MAAAGRNGDGDPPRDAPEAAASQSQIIKALFERLTRTEEALELERKRHSRTQRMGKIGSWELDLQRGDLSWSDEVFAIFGTTPDEFRPTYDSFLALAHPEDASAIDAAYVQSLRTREPFAIRHRIVTRSGEVRWVEERCETDYDSSGRPLLSRGTVQDITEGAAAAETARISNEAVAQFIRLSPEAILVADENGIIQAVSEGAQEVFRASEADLVGSELELLIPEESRAAHRGHVARFMASGETTLRMGQRATIAGRRHTGETFPAEASLVKLPTSGGGRFAVILRDLSERMTHEAMLRAAKVRAETASEAKSAFLANMSHEVRTPMNGVLGILSYLRSAQLEASDRELVDTAIEAGRSLMDILGAILDYATIESGRLRIELRQFYPRQLVKRLLPLHQIKAEGAGLSLVSEIADSLPDSLLGDPTRLQQILHNLIGNAVKFTPHGQVRVAIGYEEGSGDDGVLRLEVQDSGIGMTPEQLETIFERFSQADESISRTYGGTGLGLAIVKGLVDAMDGSIEVSSTPDQGSVFKVGIPVRRDTRLSGPDTASKARSISERPSLRVLLAEDHAVNAKVLSLLLTREGMQVSIARDGGEAIELFEPGRFDLVLLDIQMPRIDGITALRAIRKLETDAARRRTPVFACTAYSDEGQIRRLTLAGFDAVFPKPVDPSAILCRVLELRQSRDV